MNMGRKVYQDSKTVKTLGQKLSMGHLTMGHHLPS